MEQTSLQKPPFQKIYAYAVMLSSFFVPSYAKGNSTEVVKHVYAIPLIIVRVYYPKNQDFGGENWDFSIFPYTLVLTIFMVAATILASYLVVEKDPTVIQRNTWGIFGTSLLHLLYFAGINALAQPRFSFTTIAWPAYLNLAFTVAFLIFFYQNNPPKITPSASLPSTE